MRIKQPQFSKIFAAHDNPAERSQFAAAAWAETIAELDAGDLITKRRLKIVERYVLLSTEYEFYYPQATFEGPVGAGPNGGDVFSMKWAALLKIGDQLMKLEESLLISPKSTGVQIERPDDDNPLPTGAQKYLDRSRAN